MTSSYLELAKSALIIATPMIGGAVSTYLTLESTRSKWYFDLKKPWFTPPGWVVRPVWVMLFGCIGSGSYLVWRDGGDSARLPLAVYGLNLAFNWLWSPVFFNRKDLGQATAVVVANDCTAITCIYLFREINRTASNLFLPYLGWLSLATTLTAYMWWNNKPTEAKYRRSLLGYPLSSGPVAGGKQE